MAAEPEGNKALKPDPDLSVVILCYRGEEHILPYIHSIRDTLAAAKTRFELVLVANYDRGATDRTPAIMQAEEKKDSRITCVSLGKEGMMGWDLRSGLHRARGKYISFVDGDGQTPPGDLLRLYELLTSGQYDLCKVYRTPREDAPYRLWLSRVYNFVFRCVFPSVHCRDINAKPKMMTRAAYLQMQLRSSDWFIDAEIVLEATRLKLRIAELPGHSRANTWRKSFVRLSAVLEFLLNIPRYRLRYWFH